MQNDPFEDVFPIENGDFPLLCLITGVYSSNTGSPSLGNGDLLLESRIRIGSGSVSPFAIFSFQSQTISMICTILVETPPAATFLGLDNSHTTKRMPDDQYQVCQLPIACRGDQLVWPSLDKSLDRCPGHVTEYLFKAIYPRHAQDKPSNFQMGLRPTETLRFTLWRW